jgi:transposase InsO family protein
MREGQPLVVRTSANQEWALDFVHDAVECGRTIHVLNVVDAYTRECLALEVDTSFVSLRVTRVLEAIVAERGQLLAIRCDNGPELTSRYFSGLVCGAADRVSAHAAGKADAEWASRKFLRTDAGRVFEPELVSKSVRRAAQDCGVVDGVQRGETAQQSGIQNTEGICRSSGRELLQS